MQTECAPGGQSILRLRRKVDGAIRRHDTTFTVFVDDVFDGDALGGRVFFDGSQFARLGAGLLARGGLGNGTFGTRMGRSDGFRRLGVGTRTLLGGRLGRLGRAYARLTGSLNDGGGTGGERDRHDGGTPEAGAAQTRKGGDRVHRLGVA